MPPIRLEGEVSLRSDICTAWTLIADTERQNRLIGLGPLQIVPSDDAAGAARFLVRTRLSGFAVEWEDLPTEFVRYEWFRIRRRFRSGPMRLLELEAKLTPEGTGSRLRMVLTLDPKLLILRPVARINGGRSLRAMLALAAELDRSGGTVAARSDIAHPAQAEPLERARAGLRRALPPPLQPLGDRLCDLVANAPDHDLVRIRPFELAEKWGVSRDELLHACLVAVVEGLLELSWDALCPSCRGPSARSASLGDVTKHGECTLCDLKFEMTLDESLEATFTPAAGIRRIEPGPFCISGPSRLPHVVSQAVLPPDAPATLRAPAEPGRYRLFIRGGETVPVRVDADGPAEATFAPGAGPLQLRPGAAISIPSRGVETHVKLEYLQWSNQGVTAQHLALTPAFRRLFSREALRPGVALAVKRVALLFSDLTGSTALYTRVGDAVAFGVVQEHFEVLAGVVAQFGGAVVKTIGDAVMAAFPDEASAVQAALEMQRAFAGFAGRGGILPPDALKVGGYSGPCYAVSANGALDYFGQSVNIAARLQGAADPGEIVLPADVAERAREGGLLGGAEVSERFQTILKGLDVQLWAVRVRLPAEEVQAART